MRDFMKNKLPQLLGIVIGVQTMLGNVTFNMDKLPGVSIVQSASAKEATKTIYTCPMHPQIRSDNPGKCPICGMDLVVLDSGHSHDKPTNTKDSDHKVLYWYDPMRPDKRFDQPGKSPFMDMELVPKYADGLENSNVIEISAETIQKMNVRTQQVQSSKFGQSIHANGTILVNERSRVDIVSQVEGRVDDLQHNIAFDRVKKGELFYTLASPQLIELQKDYIISSKIALSTQAPNRMKLLGFDSRVLDKLRKTRKVSDVYEKVPFYIPADGVLSSIEIRNGSYLKANDKIASIQDLSTVWVEASVPEKDLASIKEGGIARVQIPGNSEIYTTKVDYIYPSINSDTRTGKVRLIVKNKDGKLKPSGYADIEFNIAQSDRITVPSEAILRDSTGNHVIMSLGLGKFEARKVETGITGGGRTEILSGLSIGDAVVVNGQFLIDSESSLRESLNKLDTPENKDMKHDK